MDELLYREEVFQLVGLCMEIHRELGKGHDEIIYKDALVVELSRAAIPFLHWSGKGLFYETRISLITRMDSGGGHVL
jgi:GxxExxY protein